MRMIKSVSISLLVASLFIACSDNVKYTNSVSVSGVLIVPATTTSLSPSRNAPSLAPSACSGIPNGYKPLANAVLSYAKANGGAVTTDVVTDVCGAFSALVAKSASKLSFAASGYKVVTTPVENFKADVAKKFRVASTILTSSSYEISSLKLNADGSLSFVVEDNITKKPVIGLSESAFSLTENTTPKTFSSVTYQSASSSTIETVLTIDASGSMSDIVKDANGSPITDSNSVQVSRRYLTALASYDYINNLSSGDSLAINIFDGTIYFYDAAYVNGLSLTSSGVPVDLNYSVNGFETDRNKSKFVIDIYNTQSTLHGGHKQATYDYNGSFPSYGGGTNIYDALYTSIGKLKDLNTSNGKYVVLMTDGANGGSTKTAQQAIDYANSIGATVNTIGFIGATNSVLKDIASQTGGSFYEASGLNVADAFSAAQAAVNYAYKGVYNSSTAVGNKVNITLTFNHFGIQVSKDLNTTK